MLFTNRKSGPDFLLWLLISLLLVMSQTVAHNVCASSAKVGNTKSYVAHIEATFEDTKTSILIQEYFQSLSSLDEVELGAAVQTFNGESVLAIFNYSSTELFYIADDECSVSHSLPTFKNVLPEDPDNGETTFIYSTKEILRTIEDTVCVSLPNGTVRGIEAEHFRGYNITQSGPFENTTVDIYISRDNWITENNNTGPVPLRIEFCGKLKSSGQDSCRYFDYFYFTFVDVFSFKERESVFEIPPGIYCSGRTNQSSIPVLPLSYSVIIEFVDPVENSVKISKLWVSNEYQMVRRDFHPISYADAGHPVTEIYNYRTGTVYTKDNLLLNCSYNKLQNADTNDDDILQHILDVMNGKATGMVDTLEMLQLDSDNTFYNGQRTLREVSCDVFISMKTIQTESGTSKNVTFEYYFMANDWQLIPDRGGPDSVITQVPMMLEISYIHNGQERNYFYNFFDFSGVVSYKDFDLSACYNQTQDIVFKITFKGQYIPSVRNAFEKTVHSQIADYGRVAPYRVQNIHLEYDEDYVFVFASIIDPAPPETLFTLHENKMIKSKSQRMLMFKKFTLSLCATECVEYGKCYGFELTADGVCTITSMMFSEKNSDSQLQDSQGTNFYARTTTHYVKWESNSNVWNNLFSSVYNRILDFELIEPATHNTFEYTSYHIELLKGDVSTISIPVFEKQVYFHEEITLPAYEETAYHDIWFDNVRNLMRLDQYAKASQPPFYTPGILTTIHDYNTGLAYYINKDLRNCRVLPISNTSIDAEMQKVGNTSVVRMKTAQQFFFTDQPYKSIGQKTVRGVLCDVYEAVRNDYIVPGRTMPSESTFRYYMANEQDTEKTSEMDNVQSEPIMLEIISESVTYYAVHSFFDFDQAPIPMDVFDVKDCYEVTNDFMFQIMFEGKSVEAARENPHEFIQIAQMQIVKITNVELLRIQEPVVEYDDKHVYLTAKLIPFPEIKGDAKVTKPPVKSVDAINKLKNQVVAGYFVVNLNKPDPTSYKAVSMRDDVRSTDSDELRMENNLRKFSLYKRETSIIQSKVTYTFPKMSVDDCASVCLVSNTKCEGFGFCVKQGFCYLTGEHPDAHPDNAKPQKGCLVYNRNYINEYDKKPGKSMVLKGDKPVDAESDMDCAKQCTLNKDFICESFEYCPGLQECTLSKVHTMNVPDDQISFTPDCDIYSRSFLAEFHVTRNTTVKMVNNEILGGVMLSECAKACMEMEHWSCSNFDYCESTQECRLVYKDVEKSGQVSFEKSAVCDHYSRIAGTYYQHKGSSSVKIYGKADFVKVAFILLFCGILIGVVTMFIYIRRKTRIGL